MIIDIFFSIYHNFFIKTGKICSNKIIFFIKDKIWSSKRLFPKAMHLEKGMVV